jgi:dTDP-4-amino-4,6-dideoxygalactose transaminase
MLKEKGIPSMIYYPRGLHQQEAYRWMNLPDEWYPNTMEATKRILALPMHPYMTEEMVDQVVTSLIGE